MDKEIDKSSYYRKEFLIAMGAEEIDGHTYLKLGKYIFEPVGDFYQVRNTVQETEKKDDAHTP